MRRRCWYGRDAQRCAVDLWQHGGSSLRRTAEWVRSVAGRQERWGLWQPWTAPPERARRCRLAASTVQRWLDRAGAQAEQATRRGLADVPTSGLRATAGVWATLGGKAQAVALLLADRVSGVVYPPVVVDGEDDPAAWGRVALRVSQVRGVVSDGSRGLARFLEDRLVGVHHQRCVFHLWRNLARPLHAALTEAVGSLRGAAATAVRRATRRELAALVHAVLDAADDATAVAALRTLVAHRRGAALARALRNEVDAALVYQAPGLTGLGRVGPEWLWRDFRLRLSHGRNHRSHARLERAATRWAVYHNWEPAQRRQEHKRTYPRSGLSPLDRAGDGAG